MALSADQVVEVLEREEGVQAYEDDDGDIRFSVTAPSDDDADSVIRDLTDLCPGWRAEWVGEGNTDATGYSTEDVYLSRIE